jgi:hypothetical protein
MQLLSIARLMRRLEHRAVGGLIRRVVTPPALTIQFACLLTLPLLSLLVVLVRAVRSHASVPTPTYAPAVGLRLTGPI